MSRTIDATLPVIPDDAITHANADPERHQLSDLLPLHFQTLPDTCQTLSQTVLHQIQSLTMKHNAADDNIDTTLSSQEEDALDDGFLLCDLKIVQRKLRAWHKMFPRIKPFFALKCNPDVMVAHVLGLNPGCGFDCASISEIKLALSSTGGDSRRCIYANPQRARDDLDQSLELGIGALTFDGIEELHKVKDAYERHLQKCQKDTDEVEPSPLSLRPQMILRILVPDSHSSVPLGEKFGASPQRVEMLTEEALKLGFDVIGVSFHCGSGCHDAEAYGTAIRIAKDTIDVIDSVIDRWNNKDGKTRKRCTLLDIGGGYPGFDGVGADEHRFTANSDRRLSLGNGLLRNEDLEDETTFEISKVVSPLIDKLFPPDKSPIKVISEPGRYFVEAAFAYCARIYSVKVDENSRDYHYFIAQGVQGLFKDVLLCNECFIPIPLMVNDEDRGVSEDIKRPKDVLHDSFIHGPSGEDFDKVSNCKLPMLRVGDWLIFDRMGAYTLSIAARNRSLPVRYVVGGGKTSR